MKLTISILGADGAVKAAAQGEDLVRLVYRAAYEEGDTITMTSDVPGFTVSLLEDSMAQTFGYLNGEYRMNIPFGEKKISYSPKNFVGEVHLLWARAATEAEIAARKNLCLNVLDCHENAGLYPHATANVETRGESVFAGRNAIDGCYASESHGAWPYQSWGINRNPDAELTIDFGRSVTIDELVITLRADFPHDNWWHTATVTFSDGSSFEPHFVKSGEPQHFAIEKRTVTFLKLGKLLKDETDPSPFPALTQIEAWGTEA